MPKRPPRQPRWIAHLMHGKRAERLGEVFADTEAEARRKACEEYDVKADWQRKRVFVQREDQ